MNNILKLLRELCVDIINRIDTGNCDISDEGATTLISCIRQVTNKEDRISKYEACLVLNIHRSTFDNYVREGKLPKGEHKIGFKELSWSRRDLLELIRKSNSNNK